MRVRATRKGYYGRLREPDSASAVFDLTHPDHFSQAWMARVDESEPTEPVAADAVPDEPEEPESPLSKRPVAELREMAEARGIDHADVSKKDLADRIAAHDSDPSRLA